MNGEHPNIREAPTTERIASHTPGPWGIEYHGETLEVCVPAPIGRKVIASIETGFDEPFESQQHANARLITAAPELYEVCRQLLDWVHGHRPGRAVTDAITGRLVAAINKAEGRS